MCKNYSVKKRHRHRIEIPIYDCMNASHYSIIIIVTFSIMNTNRNSFCSACSHYLNYTFRCIGLSIVKKESGKCITVHCIVQTLIRSDHATRWETSSDDDQSRYNSIMMISSEVFTQCGERRRVNSETKAQTKTYVSITSALPASMAPDQRNASEETSVSRVSREDAREARHKDVAGI